jgi:superfamily II DNA/RNA helicase
MLDMGFVKDMRTILAKLPARRQSLFFSATVDARVRVLIDEFTKDPVTISVKTGDTGANIDQNIIRYSSSEDKLEKLHSLLMEQRENKILIFDATKRGADRLSKKLAARGFTVEVTHGNKSLGQRKRALSRFKANDARVMVATDVAARGIDVVDITHVINYSVPNSYDDYVHRIGRAGRAGRIGYALTFIAS